MTDHSMVEERDDVRPPDARTITATDVQGWFKKIRPNDAQCVEIADRLTKMRWPSDPLPDDAKEWYWRARMWRPTDPPLQKPDSVGTKDWCDFKQPAGPGGIADIKYVLQANDSGLAQETLDHVMRMQGVADRALRQLGKRPPPRKAETLLGDLQIWVRQDINWDPTLPDPGSVETNGWWDEFQGAADAADKLRDSIPNMLARLDRPETRNGYNAIKAVGDALAAAKPYLGNSKPSHRKRPKDWHTPTVLVALIIGKALAMSGHDPSLERDSVLVGAVNKALCRMGYTVEPGTISAFLKRWEHKYGLGFKQAE